MKAKSRYRPPSSYHALTPEAKARQLAGLKRGRTKGSVKPVAGPQYDPFVKQDVIPWLETFYLLPETKQPVKLETWQRERIFEPLFDVDPATGLRRYTLALIGTPKKNSKSTMAAMVACYFLFQDEDFGEILLAASSKEQVSWTVFEKLRRAVMMNANLSRHCKVQDDYIENARTGTVARVIALNYKTAAGMNPNLVIFDELWSYEDTPGMTARRFYDELTTPPTRKQPLTLIVTYAGYDEDSLLHELYKQGMAGADPRTFFFWTHENLASWITPEYLETQKKRLRPNTYLRLHENRWTASEDRFIDMADFDRCVHADYVPMLPSKTIRVFAGIDASVTGDSTAGVAVARMGNKVVLVRHRKWQPSKAEPIDLEKTVEAFVRELHRDFRLEKAYYDPYQLHRSATTLANEGIPMEAFNQTTGNLTEMSQNLYNLIHGGNIEMYPDDELRAHAAAAMAQETPRGFRIVKDVKSKKIDLIIAMAMAALAAVKESAEGLNIYFLDVRTPEKPEDYNPMFDDRAWRAW